MGEEKTGDNLVSSLSRLAAGKTSPIETFDAGKSLKNAPDPAVVDAKASPVEGRRPSTLAKRAARPGHFMYLAATALAVVPTSAYAAGKGAATHGFFNPEFILVSAAGLLIGGLVFIITAAIRKIKRESVSIEPRKQEPPPSTVQEANVSADQSPKPMLPAIRQDGDSVDIALKSAGVAPDHAVIETVSGNPVLRAQGAAPLYLNGQPILAAPLRHGDLVSVGELRIMIELPGKAPVRAPQKPRPSLQLINGKAEPHIDPEHSHSPSLRVVRDLPSNALSAHQESRQNATIVLKVYEAGKLKKTYPLHAQRVRLGSSLESAAPNSPEPPQPTVPLPDSIMLKVYNGGKMERAQIFKTDRISIGAGDSADLNLISAGIEPSHAFIESRAAGPVLRAQGSAPVYLNGQPIFAAPLRRGDLIAIGDLRILAELLKDGPTPVPQRPRSHLQLISIEEEPLINQERPHPPALRIVHEGVHE